jgi:diphthamide biosynthesis methyltransferase
MKGIKYLTDDRGSKTALLIDLKKHDKRLDSSIEDMLDILESERIKDEPTVSFDQAMKNLYKKGSISKKVYDKVVHGL